MTDKEDETLRPMVERACPARKCKKYEGHDEGVHGRQPPRRTPLGLPIQSRARRRHPPAQGR